jgi:hypothetical protein
MRKYVIAAILLLLLGGCSFFQENSSPVALPTPTIPQSTVQVEQIPTPTPIMPPVLTGDVGVQQLMLFSHSRWKNLIAEYSITFYPSDASAEPEVQTVQLWIRLPAEYKTVITQNDKEISALRISDGKSMLDDEGNRSEVPAFLFEPFNPPNYPSDTVYPHPLAGYLATPVSDLIFPAGLAQRGGEYQITGSEIIAGRESQVVEWSRSPGVVTDRLWVDKITGVVLRQQNYGKQQSISPISDIQASFIKFDGEIQANTFALDQVPTPAPTPTSLTAESASVTVLSQVVNIRSGPNTGYEVIATVETGKVLPVIGRNETDDWWKVMLNGETGWIFGAFVEFSGDPETVPIVIY